MNDMTTIIGRLATGMVAVAAVAITAVGAAAAPVAVVEDISGPPAGVQPFDFLDQGQIIRLQAANTLVLGYLGSCWRESIVGGTVNVGAEQSTVDGGQVGRERVECDGGRARLTADQAARSGAMTFRNVGQPRPPARYELFGLSPIVALGAPGPLVIERIDRQATRIDVNVAARDLNHGMYDLARAGFVLQAGGLYRAKSGEREVVFHVNQLARPGAVPVVSRLVQF
jgi:hypothetical protein